MTEKPDKPTDEEARAFDLHFRDLLHKRGVETLTCPACGAEAWGGFTDAGVHVLEGRDPSSGEVGGIAGSVHLLLTACGKCGFTALFDREIIGE